MMEAKDTVIDLTDMDNCSLRIAMTSILTQQAEITWDKAIREVVEWIEEQGQETFRTGYYPSQEMWQAQKKVWFNEKE